MSDPRNVAHDKKVKQEKEHHEATAGGDAKPRKGRSKKTTDQDVTAAPSTAAEVPKIAQGPGDLEKSVAVLSKLKEMEFHSRANIETLAALSLTVEDELKQKEFSEPIGEVYSAQDAFQTKIGALIASYEAKCESLRPAA